jgi:hypothetical protein
MRTGRPTPARLRAERSAGGAPRRTRLELRFSKRQHFRRRRLFALVISPPRLARAALHLFLRDIFANDNN